MAFRARVLGLEQLSNSLKAYGIKGDEALDEACSEAAWRVRDEIVTRTPVGHKLVHAPSGRRLGFVALKWIRYVGNLRRSITIQKERLKELTGNIWKIGPSKAGFYGYFLEYGTRKMRKYPFVRPAFDSVQDDALNAAVSVAKKKLGV